MKVLLATTNTAKIARLRKLMKETTVEFFMPTDLDLPVCEIEEGSDIAQNARAKALAYLGQTDFPILGMDSAFVIPGVELDPAKVKRNALVDREESSMTREEIARAILDFYCALVTEHGGRLPAYWEEVLALVFSNGTIKEARAKRPVILTTEIHGEVNPYFPLRSLYIVGATGKYVCEQSPEEEAMELRPIREALRELFGE